MNPFSKAPNVLTRRSFLRSSAYAGIGAAAATHAVRDLRLINSAMAAQGDLTGYKALVCVFLNGGNDSNNWIVPTDQATYDQYASIRGNLTLPKESLLPLRTGPDAGDPAFTDTADHTYGFHPSSPELQTLFGEKKLSFVMNVGTLVRPTTRANWTSGLAAYRPPQLFSHSDQITQWQTSIPDQPPATGWGGRMADLLDPHANQGGSISMSVSLGGANTFEIGNLVSQYQVATSGAIVLSGNLMTGTSARARALQNILALNHPNLQRTAYANVTDNAIETGETLNSKILATLDPTDSPASHTNQDFANTTWRWQTGLTGIYSDGSPGGFPNTTLGNQLKMVARIIQARGPSAFNMKRQIFFVTVGGYDTHTSQVLVQGVDDPINPAGAHYTLLRDVSRSMFAFQRAMVQLGESDNVTQFTASDFSRTLPTNSQGSDHGWGANHIVVGGAVDGGKMFGQLPIFAINGPNDTGLGRWIPTLAVDQHAATLAKWFGVHSTVMADIFPNLSRFSSSDLGFML